MPAISSLAAAGSKRALAAGQRLYEQGELAETLFLLESGQVELRTLRRGTTVPSAIRSVRSGDRFGEECVLDGARRAASALAVEACVVVEVPIAVYRRFGARSGELERDEQRLKRAMRKDALLASSLGQALRDRDLEDIAAELDFVEVKRGERLYAAGDRASSGFVLADGLVQLDGDSPNAAAVFAYLSRGDLFGDEEALRGVRRELGALALGDSLCLAFPEPVLRRIDNGYPGLLLRSRRVLARRRARQLDVVADAGSKHTAHVFKDLYRLQIARSLLAIDLERCVRCGHCAQSCADVHGVSRLVRRGDKVVTRVSDATTESAPADLLPKNLLLPNTCQHCENAACMIECPTGAIGRDGNGEVFIREDLCTGCGACAKACPWENIQMAPRAHKAETLSAEVAVKCDLCRGLEAPACVSACPADAIVRVDPTQAFDEVRALLGSELAAAPTAKQRRATLLPWLGAGALLGLTLGLDLVRRSAGLAPSKGVGLVLGFVAAALILVCAAYVVPKRAVRLWMRLRARHGRQQAPAAKTSPSGMRWLVGLHVTLGSLGFVAMLGHAGLGSSRGIFLPLTVSLWTAVVSGVLSALAYRFVPRILTPLERTGLLPEDFPGERQRLLEALEARVSQKSSVVKVLFARLLLPYARSPIGFVPLLIAGRGLRDEEQRLRARIGGLLAGRAEAKLDGLDALIKNAVELRALSARRTLTALIRGLPLLHALASALFVLLLLTHVVGALLARVWLWSGP